ncbi:hypothetical protein COEREDRAFT_87207 [Coemansia reversa NRRL 1564]|uniref:Uncharacterized protein n=1 Tax=Coemansia reversa (strain ATCC 12441 / NRRL 1564) TaxID=763665 RepID=A0A2G5BB55_COERN|nr:hypothetical protein COEREDRAFT_87207 [Coemansia reversa NRRL 1564]|eukprot:PIA16241.1 hypothetical protein COEREDRAFT_87207 [Coemansia reversa NRRL 1564]
MSSTTSDNEAADASGNQENLVEVCLIVVLQQADIIFINKKWERNLNIYSKVQEICPVFESIKIESKENVDCKDDDIVGDKAENGKLTLYVYTNNSDFENLRGDDELLVQATSCRGSRKC